MFRVSLKLTVLLLLIFSSCRFKIPSAAEQAEMERRGAFPGGTPAWMGSSAVTSHRSSGSALVPTTFGNQSESSIEKKREEVLRAQEELQRRRESVNVVGANSTGSGKERVSEKQESPLWRIESICPGTESSVTEAITTLERGQRIERYTALTRRCSASWDLWLWLGKDYYQEGMLDKSAKCLERVLSLNSGNKEASDLLTKIRNASASEEF